MEINTHKSIVSAIDYDTGRSLPTDMIHYRGIRLARSDKSTANKYLGVHVSLDLRWGTEKRYVLRKTREAVKHLLHTALRRDQIDMLLRVCVEPLFRYSAPLIPWTERELRTMDRLWAQGKKASLKLTSSTDNAIIFLSQQEGGLGLRPALWHQMKELRTHILQSTSRRDELDRLIRDRNRWLMERVPAVDMKEAGSQLTLHQGWEPYRTSPIWRLQEILTRIDENWHICMQTQQEEAVPAHPTELARTVRTLAQTRRENTSLFPLGDQMEPGAWTQSRTEKLIFDLHACGMYEAKHMLGKDGISVIPLASLPRRIQRRMTSGMHTQLSQELVHTHTFQESYRKHCIKASIRNMDLAPRKRARPRNEEYVMNTNAWADVQDFTTEEQAHAAIGTLILKTFGKKPYAGIVVAAAAPERAEEDWTLRVVFSDGDFEDMDPKEVEAGEQNLLDYDPIPSHLELGIPMAEQIHDAEWYAEEWRKARGKHLEKAVTKLKGMLGDMHLMATQKWEQKAWHHVTYQLDKSEIDKGYVYASKMTVDRKSGRTWPTDEREKITPNDALGVHTRIDVGDNGLIVASELDRLQGWGGNEDSCQAGHLTTASRHPTMTGSMHAYVSQTLAKHTCHRPTLPEHEPAVPYEYGLLTGQKRLAPIEIDWNAQNTQVCKSLCKQVLAVTRNGRTSVFRKRQDGKDIPADGLFSAKIRKTRLREGWELLGILDSRRAHLMAARGGEDMHTYLPQLADALQREDRRQQPHWLLTAKARTLQAAAGIIGVSATNPDPNFESVSESMEDWRTVGERHGAVVVWLTPETTIKAEDLQELADCSEGGGSVCALSMGRLEQKTDRWLRTHMKCVSTIPRGTPCMQHRESASTGNLCPTTCTSPVLVWVLGKFCTTVVSDLKQQPFWDKPYRTIPTLTGKWWSVFHAHDQAARFQDAEGTVAATDGSSKEIPLESGAVLHLAGSGTTYRTQDNIPDTQERIQCHVSSLIPEIHAARMAIRDSPKDRPLTILTDSASLMWIADALRQMLRWRDFRKHPQIEIIMALAEDLNSRRATTTMVKVAAHKGSYMNEVADELADEVASEEIGISASYDTRYGEDIPIKTPMDEQHIGPTPLVRLIPEQGLKGLLVRRREMMERTNMTSSLKALRTEGSGRQFLGRALQSLPPKAARRAIQINTSTFPSQARLKLWGKERSATCPFCQQEAETTAHFSQTCPQFQDARTVAHDAAWGATWAEIMTHKDKGWEALHDTKMRDSGLRHDALWTEHRPDGILLNRNQGKIILLEFTRCAGRTAEEARKAQQEKERKYQLLATNIAEENHADFRAGAHIMALACTFTGAIDEGHWRRELSTILDKNKQRMGDKVMGEAVKATLEAFSCMADIRQTRKSMNRVVET